MLDTAAVLAAHVAASLDAAISLQRERLSAATDPLTGILNRRGLEQRLERELATAQEARVPVSLIVIDCDDFKEINDRAGHEFGDAMLREVADVLTGALPEGAEAARLGGDEFVVMLPGAGADAAEALGGQIRTLLAEGLTEAGLPAAHLGRCLDLSVRRGEAVVAAARRRPGAVRGEGLGQGSDRLVPGAGRNRAGDPVSGPNRRARRKPARPERRLGRGALRCHDSRQGDRVGDDRRRHLRPTLQGARVRRRRHRLLDVAVVGDYIVDATDHALREVSLGDEAAYRISDFPLTAEVLRTGEPRAVSFADGDVEPAEAFILRDLGMNALMMLPVMIRGRAWGLVELYEMRLRRFGEDDIAVAQFLVAQAQRRLELVAGSDDAFRRPRVYELPADAGDVAATADEIGAAAYVARERRATDTGHRVVDVLDVEDEPSA